MPFPYTWTPTRLIPTSASQVKVLTYGNQPASLSTPVSLTDGEIAFALTAPGHYKIAIQKGTERYVGLFRVDETGVDTSDPEQAEYTRNAPIDPVAGDGSPVVPIRYIAEDSGNPGLYKIVDGDTGGRIVTVDDNFKLPSVVEEGLASTYVRFLDTDGNPISGSLVTIVVDTVLNEISDITVEEI